MKGFGRRFFVGDASRCFELRVGLDAQLVALVNEVLRDCLR
jgi:hypothetical protein